MTKKQKNCCVFAVALLVDQATKYGATVLLPSLSRSRFFFYFALHRNNGISFSLFEKSPHLSFFIALSGLLLSLIVFSRLKYPESFFGGALLLAGATGNLIDRIRWGYVTDWIYIGGLHINIADIMLCTGGLLFLFLREEGL